MPHVPDFDVDWRVARRFVDALQLLLAYMEAVPSPPRMLASKLGDLVMDLDHPELLAGAAPEARDLASALANWVARCTTAVERPWELELDDYPGT
jgi:hypothetical protein